MREPETREEWQEAVDAAHVMLLIMDAERYGLIETDLRIRGLRCAVLIEKAKATMGIVPSADAVERFLANEA